MHSVLVFRVDSLRVWVSVEEGLFGFISSALGNLIIEHLAMFYHQGDESGSDSSSSSTSNSRLCLCMFGIWGEERESGDQGKAEAGNKVGGSE